MHIAIIGGGLAGLTTAHALLKKKLQITIFEAEAIPGSKASWANGAQLSYSFTDPFASPQLLRSLPRIICGRAPAIKIQHKAEYQYVRWCAEFLWNCLPHRTRANTLELERLAARSCELMALYHEHPELQYYNAHKGKLVLLDEAPDERMRLAQQRKKAQGIDTRLLNRTQALNLSPELGTWQSDFSHAIYATGDGVADPREFTRSLSSYLAKKGVTQHFNTRVQHLTPTNRGITVDTRESSFEFDAVAVCAGNQSGELLQSTSNPPRLYPITGYSLSLPLGSQCPNPSVTALSQRLVMANLGESVRIAGLADINVRPTQHADRLKYLLDTAETLAPKAADYSGRDKAEWVGHRPSTAAGPPVVGATSIPGIYQNVGHGSLGWTLAAATAEIAANAIMRQHNYA